jgi:hypothetical protein
VRCCRSTLPAHCSRNYPRRELGEDIKKNGLIESITITGSAKAWGLARHAQLLDGRNRLDAMELVGMFPFTAAGNPSVHLRQRRQSLWQATGWQTSRSLYVCHSANLRRRHLNREQKQQLIDQLLKADPQRSNRAIARVAQSSDVTVGSRRDKLEAAGEIPEVGATTGLDGRTRRVERVVAAVPRHDNSKIREEASETVTRLRRRAVERTIEIATDSSLAAGGKIQQPIISVPIQNNLPPSQTEAVLRAQIDMPGSFQEDVASDSPPEQEFQAVGTVVTYGQTLYVSTGEQFLEEVLRMVEQQQPTLTAVPLDKRLRWFQSMMEKMQIEGEVTLPDGTRTVPVSDLPEIAKRGSFEFRMGDVAPGERLGASAWS